MFCDQNQFFENRNCSLNCAYIIETSQRLITNKLNLQSVNHYNAKIDHHNSTKLRGIRCTKTETSTSHGHLEGVAGASLTASQDSLYHREENSLYLRLTKTRSAQEKDHIAKIPPDFKETTYSVKRVT